jgi:GTP-binding protein HflX
VSGALLSALENPSKTFESRSRPCTGEGIVERLAAIDAALPAPSIELELLIPYDRGELISSLHDNGRIVATSYEEGGTRVTALVTEEHAATLRPFSVAPLAAVL